MEHVLDHRNPNQKYFEEISKIPRQSFREQAISDYIADFAKARGLWFNQDSLGNVIIKKKGTKGSEQSAPVMLQAHLDMVCEKEPGSSFDFASEPIRLALEDGWVTARGTTLGADDGAGVALMLAILDDQTLTHPPLECVFTVQEEDGMGGALQLDYSKLSSKKLIALDGLEEGTTIVSTTGIHSGYIVKDCPMLPVAEDVNLHNDQAIFSLKIYGLRGGHAALNIGKGQGNAIQIAAEILSAIFCEFPVRLISISGGTILNGIPQECEAVFTLAGSAGESGKGCCDAAGEQHRDVSGELQRIVQEAAREILLRLNGGDPGLRAELKPCQNTGLAIDEAATAMDEAATKEVIDLICLLPAGVETWDRDHPDFPVASRNLGTVSLQRRGIVSMERCQDTASTEHARLLIGYSCRGIMNKQISEMAKETGRIAEDHNAVYQKKFGYSGYTIGESSPLIGVWSDVYKKETGKELIRRRIHSGTDAGTIAENMGGMDIIVLMPNTRNVHTPEERMELASFDRTYHYLKKILERL